MQAASPAGGRGADSGFFAFLGSRLLIPIQARLACRLNSHPHDRGYQQSYPDDPQDVPEPGDHSNDGAHLSGHPRNLDKD